MMTPRERVKAVINFRKPDVLPWCEVIWEETPYAWIEQTGGKLLKKWIKYEIKDFMDGAWIMSIATIKGLDPYKELGCISLQGLYVPVDLSPIPRFKGRVLKETENYIDYMSPVGVIVRVNKKAEYLGYNMPMYIDFPVKDRKSWEEYKKRLNPEDPRRYPKDWEGNKDEYRKVFEQYQTGPTMVFIGGLWAFIMSIMGIPKVSMFYEDSELMHDIADYWEYFTIEALRDLLETLRGQIDMTWMWEDFAEKHGPFFSPKIFKEFFLPHYKNLTSFFHKNGVKVMLDCDGNFNALLDSLTETGVDGLWPLEVNSGMDAITIKKKYGNKFFLIGNIDKRAVAKGGETMHKEVDSKVPILKELGGYIPGLDHNVYVEITLDKFKEYAEYLKRYLPY